MVLKEIDGERPLPDRQHDRTRATSLFLSLWVFLAIPTSILGCFSSKSTFNFSFVILFHPFRGEKQEREVSLTSPVLHLEIGKTSEEMMGRRDAPLMRGNGQSFRGSRIAVAIGIGILLGSVFAFLHPDGFFLRFPYREERLQVNSTHCESSEGFKTLRTELDSLSEKNKDLKNQIRRLNLKLQLAEKSKDHAEKQFLMLGKQQKAGAFGTVKSLRTNPSVIPDPTINPRLQAILEKVAVNKELIVAVANTNVWDMLEVWFNSIKHVGITNYLVVALDDETVSFCETMGVPVYRRNPDEGVDSVAKNGDNHAISGLKFRILREFLQMGYNVLLSDVDIVYLQNPFEHLYRDCDVESMTDGHDNMTAYGYNDVFDEPAMGWARYAHTMRIWVYNSGFFYIRPTIPSIELLDRVAERLANGHKLWDQAVFNEELFFPSHPGYDGLHASKRTMDFYEFLNSKVLFKRIRKDPNLSKIKPVIVHINYHPDKLSRMKAVVEYYVNGKEDALKNFPDGSDW